MFGVSHNVFSSYDFFDPCKTFVLPAVVPEESLSISDTEMPIEHISVVNQITEGNEGADDFTEARKRVFGLVAKVCLPYEVSLNFFKLIENICSTLKNEKALFFGDTIDKPDMYLFSNAFFRVRQIISKGNQSEVALGDLIELELGGIKSMVIKISRETNRFKKSSVFSPEFKLMNQIKKTDENALKCLDVIQAKGLVEKYGRDYFYGLYEPCSMDLNQINYNIQAPASQILNPLIHAAIGITTLHKMGLVVHSDIKADNILLSADGQTAKVTDFGCIIEYLSEWNKEHRTQITPFHAAPWIWKDWKSQSEQSGNQKNPAIDSFSFGRMLEYEVILKVLDQLLSYGIEKRIGDIDSLKFNYEELRQKLAPIENDYNLEDGEDEIVKLDLANRGRLIVVGISEAGILKTLLFPSHQTILNLTIQAITLFKNILPSYEFNKLKSMAVLASKLQDSDYKMILPMNKVVRELELINRKGEYIGEKAKTNQFLCNYQKMIKSGVVKKINFEV